MGQAGPSPLISDGGGLGVGPSYQTFQAFQDSHRGFSFLAWTPFFCFLHPSPLLRPTLSFYLGCPGAGLQKGARWTRAQTLHHHALGPVSTSLPPPTRKSFTKHFPQPHPLVEFCTALHLPLPKSSHSGLLLGLQPSQPWFTTTSHIWVISTQSPLGSGGAGGWGDRGGWVSPGATQY